MQNGQRSYNLFNEFPNLNITEIKKYEKLFQDHDTQEKGFLDLEECKKIMEAVGRPQTHLGLKRLIKQASENEPVKMNPNNTLSLYGFLSIFNRVDEDDPNNNNAGDLDQMMGNNNGNRDKEVDVSSRGVLGARDFFSSKISQQSRGNKAEEEIKKAQAERKKMMQEKHVRKNTFKDKINMWNNVKD